MPNLLRSYESVSKAEQPLSQAFVCIVFERKTPVRKWGFAVVKFGVS
jgi:hypothetical protein